MKSKSPLLVLALFVFVTVVPEAFAADGAALYKGKCAACHGADGAGKTKMGEKLALKDLASAEVQKISDADMSKLITDGKEKMPGFGKKLSAEEITALVAHVRTFAK